MRIFFNVVVFGERIRLNSSSFTKYNSGKESMDKSVRESVVVRKYDELKMDR